MFEFVWLKTIKHETKFIYESNLLISFWMILILINLLMCKEVSDHCGTTCGCKNTTQKFNSALGNFLFLKFFPIDLDC